MTDTPKFISWMRWQDPMGRSRDNLEYVPEKEVTKFDNDRNDVFNDETEEDDDLVEPRPVIVTPLGVLPLRPFNDPTKVFNFWLGETNFDLSMEVVKILNDVPGVEILDVFTRYKFRIAIGNNFKFQDVRQNIEHVLNATPPVKQTELKVLEENMKLDKDTEVKVKQLINLQLSKFPYWAIFILPNGQIDITSSYDKNAEFEEKLAIYKDAKRLAGGAIFQFDEQLT